MGRKTITRRHFIQIAGATGLASVLCFHGGCGASSRKRVAKAGGKRVVVIGVDGFDPGLCTRLMNAGRLPNLAKLRDGGGFRPLGSSTPPQSPVAWASFITGADAGVHGIFDFIHRDPRKPFEQSLYYSASETVAATEGWEIGEHKLPITMWPFNHPTTHTLLKREGVPFWDYLDEAGVPSWFYDIPANYPPSPSKHGGHCCLAGMGVPDLIGSYGTYQCFSTRSRPQRGGGMEVPISFRNHVAKTKLSGPLNTMLKNPVATELPMEIYRHPTDALARIEVGGATIVLQKGEWSDWRKMTFPLGTPWFLPNEKVSGICRFYLQEVWPHFQLYVSPLNIDPADPGQQQVSEPGPFVQEIAAQLGSFSTLGFQEDHKALTNGVFTDEEFRSQADYVLQERMNLLNYALEHYDSGLLFFYFSSTDLQAHMFWWEGDQPHPTRTPEAARKYMAVLEDLYARLDGVVGDLLQRFGDNATVMLLSDHGFCNFGRQFNLNTWLRDNGYLGPADCRSLTDDTHGKRVDWSRTRAYALGLNGLYVNLQGREQAGIVTAEQRDGLLEELRAKLLDVRDPINGERAIAEVVRADQAYRGPMAAHAPDLIVGYRRGWRCSWETALGTITREAFSENKEAWSADHCVAAGEVPGVLFANRPIEHGAPSLVDLAPTILEEFGLSVPVQMTGRNVFRTT